MLQVDIPEVRRGNRVVLRNVRFTTSSRVTCLRGRNGSGKTTLLLALAGLVQHSGRVVAVPEIRSPGVYVEDEEFYGHVTVREFLRVISWFRGEVNDVFGIDYNGKIKDLSTGQRKKLYLTLALSGKHDWLLLDEPFSNLDERSVGALRDYLRNVGSPVVLTTQVEDELCGEYVNVEEFAA